MCAVLLAAPLLSSSRAAEAVPAAVFRKRNEFPVPPYPAEAVEAGVQGVARVQIKFDDRGDVLDATVVKSTGNAALDDNLPRFIKARWQGRTAPAYAKTVEFVYRLQRGASSYFSPIPIYSAAAKAVRIHNYVKFLVTFSVHGEVEKIDVLHASGSRLLDDETIAFVKKYWRSYLAKPEVRKITFQFTLSDKR